MIRFLEKRFGVHEPNISPWRRAVVGDLTSVFNFSNPNNARVHLPDTDGFLPPQNELAGGNVNTFIPTINGVTIGVPKQEHGIRPARALPYELNVHGTVDTVHNTLRLEFINTGDATVVFQVRSVDPAAQVRNYTVEPHKKLHDTWNIVSTYDVSVYGPNGFVRYFKGSVGPKAAALDIQSSYRNDDGGAITWRIRNFGEHKASVVVLDAYTGRNVVELLRPDEETQGRLVVFAAVRLVRFGGDGHRRSELQLPPCRACGDGTRQLLRSGHGRHRDLEGLKP